MNTKAVSKLVDANVAGRYERKAGPRSESQPSAGTAAQNEPAADAGQVAARKPNAPSSA